MNTTPLDAIPASCRGAAHAALNAAFGPAPIRYIAPVRGGASGAFVFSVETAEQRYLLRLEGPASPLRNPHQYQSMQIAAEAGVAPRIFYINEVDRVAIIDFVDAQPLHTFPGGTCALAHALGKLTACVQATPTFPYFVDYPVIVARLWEHVCRTGLFSSGVLDACTDHLIQIRAAYVWDQTQAVSSHNDIVPSNVLFDGKRLWLIDWESAYRNDPLVDVAILLDNLASTPELERIFLRAWCGGEVEEVLYRRLHLVRSLTRLYYAGVLLSASAAMQWRRAPDSDISSMTTPEFRQAISDGRLIAGTPQTKHALGKMYLTSFLFGEIPPGLDAAV